MKITIENTSRIVELDTGSGLIPARIWEGHTESGTPVHCFITRIAATIPRDDPRQAEFVRDLQEQRAPSAAVATIPLLLLL
jgi:hypothetical protein